MKSIQINIKCQFTRFNSGKYNLRDVELISQNKRIFKGENI